MVVGASTYKCLCQVSWVQQWRWTLRLFPTSAVMFLPSPRKITAPWYGAFVSTVKITKTCSLLLTKSSIHKKCSAVRATTCSLRHSHRAMPPQFPSDISGWWPSHERKVRILFRSYFSAFQVNILMRILQVSHETCLRLRSTKNLNVYWGCCISLQNNLKYRLNKIYKAAGEKVEVQVIFNILFLCLVRALAALFYVIYSYDATVLATTLKYKSCSFRQQ